MKIRSVLATAVALAATSAALAQALGQNVAEPQTATVERTLLAELAAGMRELIEAVVPEISLPAVELKLPRFDVDRR